LSLLKSLNKRPGWESDSQQWDTRVGHRGTDLPVSLRADLLGHGGDSETTERYGCPIELQQQLKLLEKLPVVTRHLDRGGGCCHIAAYWTLRSGGHRAAEPSKNF
jgi:hypothetical protein